MIKMFIMDVDGTMTDGKINITSGGELYKSFNIKDGLGIKILKDKDIIPVIITGRDSDIVKKRADEIGIEEIYLGVDDKINIYDNILIKYGLTDDEIAYIGDDINDIEVLQRVGQPFIPADAARQLLAKGFYLLTNKGGEGAVREAIEVIIDMDIQ